MNEDIDNAIGELHGSPLSEDHEAELRTLLRELRDLRERVRWRSVKDEPPRQGDEVIACMDGTVSEAMLTNHGWFNAAFRDGGYVKCRDSDKWQPLPAPPEAK